MIKETKAQPVEDNKIKVRIAIAAAVAANCIPCFDHLYENAIAAGLSHDEIQQSVDIASKVKHGAHAALTGNIKEVMGVDNSGGGSCCSSEKGGTRCC